MWQGSATKEMLHSRIYQTLIQIAKAGGSATYSEIAPLAALDMGNAEDRDKLGQILGTISTYEHSEGRPMLSAVVVHGVYKVPGRGFFQLARHLGLLKSKADLDEPLFWHEELMKVHNFWKNARAPAGV